MDSRISQSYGSALPDQVEQIATLFDSHLEMIGDVREIYREQAALEKEFAGKLQVLARKASERKVKVENSIVLGDAPTKAWDESLLAKHTVNAAYAQIIMSIVSTAQDHNNLGDALNLQVVDVLKTTERANEETKKREIVFYQKLLSDRDRVYNERLKSKQKYDEECLEVEGLRQKQGRASDDKHADRAAKQLEQQRIDMLNAKNVYLISTAIANKAKSKFYEEDLPSLENQFQSLQTTLTQRFVKTLLHAQALQLSHLDVLKSRVAAVEKALGDGFNGANGGVNPPYDQDIFIDHNIRPFTAPADWDFEPCGSHYDVSEMSVEAAPKVFLQNKLSRCRGKLHDLGPLAEAKRRELDQLGKLVEAYISDSSLGKIEEITDNYLDTKHHVTFFSSSECILNAEITKITEALGDDEGSQQHHAFKSSSFSIPTQCGYCKSSIWGLSKQGKTCKSCNLSVHSKCELKVPADCSGTKLSRHGSSSSVSLARSTTRSSHKSTLSMQAPTPSSFVNAPTETPEAYPSARVVFDFTPTSPFELAVTEGEPVTVLEEDDGSGWVKVQNQGGGKGLVPASYIHLTDGTEAEDVNPLTSAASAQQGSGVYVRGVYEYVAQGPDELGVDEGELVELSDGPTGGRNYADGWWEGINKRGQKGIFPSNYVEAT